MLSALDLSIVAVYLAAVLFVGFRAAKKLRTGQEDYILAGRTLTLPLFVATLVPTFYGGVLGVGEYAYRYGLSNWVIMGAPYYLFAAVYAFFFAGKVRLAEGMTIPDHLEKIYGRKAALFGALLVFVLTIPAAEVLMLGILLQWISGLHLGFCVVAITALCFSFIYKGGFRSDVWTNALQFFWMFAGFALILPFAFSKAGGAGGLSGALPPLHLSWHGGNPTSKIFVWYLIALWTLIDPAFHQRACAAENPRTARLGILVCIGFWFLFDAMSTSAGLFSRAILPPLENPLFAFPELAGALLPPVVKGLFFAGMISSMLASLQADGFLSAITLAKDIAGRLIPAGPEETAPRRDERAWIRAGLIASGVLACILALMMPSVVELWYTIGSTVIPGLLFPILGCYFPAWRVSGNMALAASVCGWCFSLAAFLHPPLFGNVEPMLPGLAAAAALWSASLLLKSRTKN